MSGAMSATSLSTTAERGDVAAAIGDGELRYSTVWEDHLLLEQGLEIGPHDELLMVASAGCNVLNLLRLAPRRIVALDLNPAQTALVELKLAALRVLDHADFLALLGHSPHETRLTLYDRVRRNLSAAARAWWDTRTPLISEGIASGGRLDRYIAGFRREALSTDRARQAVSALFSIADPVERRRHADREIFTPEFVRSFRAYFTRESLGLGRHPIQMRFVDEIDVADWFIGRLRWACTELATRGNFYLARFLLGERADVEAESVGAAPYLHRSVFEQLRALAGRVEVVTDDLETYLASRSATGTTKAALSDVFEYVSSDAADVMFARLADVVRPSGRIAYWNLLVPRESPVALRRLMQPLQSLSDSLWRRDRAWFYRGFHVEEVCAR
jgi:S-adenosylmethionine-diacylglycerol 3-amino-3-carboxypropyl transferase